MIGRAWVPLLLAAAGGCGKGVVPGTAYDQPLFQMSGIVLPDGGLRGTKPVVGLLWTDPFQRKPDIPMPARGIRSTITRDPIKGDLFAVDVFRPPPPEALVEIAAPPPYQDSISLAIAELVLVDDQDGDGTFALAEPRDGGTRNTRAEIAGGDRYLAAATSVLVYVARPFATPGIYSPLNRPGRVGYDLVGYRCMGRVSLGVDPVAPFGVGLVLQPSKTLPEVRGCFRTHSP